MHGEHATPMRDRALDHSPSSDNTRLRGSFHQRIERRCVAKLGQLIAAALWRRGYGEGLDGVDHLLIGFVLLAQVLAVRRSEQRNVGDRVDE
jgi:hypothetical protein